MLPLLLLLNIFGVCLVYLSPVLFLPVLQLLLLPPVALPLCILLLQLLTTSLGIDRTTSYLPPAASAG